MPTPYWMYQQSAAVPLLIKNGELMTVLVQSRKKTKWIIPKGVIEKDLTPEDSAANEAWEEAGILGVVQAGVLAKYQYEKWGGTCDVLVFVMQVLNVLDEWPEKHKRARLIVPIEQALELIKEQAITDAPRNYVHSG